MPPIASGASLTSSFGATSSSPVGQASLPVPSHESHPPAANEPGRTKHPRPTSFLQTLEHPSSLSANPVLRCPGLPRPAPASLARASRKNLPTPLRSPRLQRPRFRLPNRLAPRSRTPQARPPQTLVPNPLPRLRSNRRPQNHLGAEPPPAPRHARPSLAVHQRRPLSSRGPRAVDSLAK